MTGLEAFGDLDRRKSSERVIGAYLCPYQLFGSINLEDPYSAALVTATCRLKELDVLVTANGGSFVKPPEQLPDRIRDNNFAGTGDSFKGKIVFEEKACNIVQ